MASVLQPFHDSITAELSALRQEIRSLSSELDTSGSSTMVGELTLDHLMLRVVFASFIDQSVATFQQPAFLSDMTGAAAVVFTWITSLPRTQSLSTGLGWLLVTPINSWQTVQSANQRSNTSTAISCGLWPALFLTANQRTCLKL